MRPPAGRDRSGGWKERMPDDRLAEELTSVARETADAARGPTLAHFRARGLAVDNKLDDGWDPVTEADRQAELAMREVIERRRPDDGILGEEFERREGSTGLVWVLDPIDGTRSYVSGSPVWGTLVAVADESGPFYGIVDQPYIGERFEGGFGKASFRRAGGGGRISVSGTSSLGDAILFTTLPEIGTEAEHRAFRRVANQAKLVRYGLDCYAYALLAAGHIDLVIEAGLNPYDVNAPIALIESAGGCATSWDGGPAHAGGTLVAAATTELHAAALEALSG